jgi:hypothetical protein
MEDLIRRSDAIKAIEALECFGYIECKTKGLVKDINAIPSADRPQGEWEDYDRYMKCCSKCGWIHDILHYGVNYCPNCGARMKGADDE